MDKPKIFLLILLAIALLLSFCCEPVQAITEAEVQAQVDSVGKEKVSGNILIWFLCAIAFLKVSQKIDSFMSSIGINVGNTGGSLLSEAMIAARSFGAIRGGSGGHFGRSSGFPTGNSAGAASFFAGGLAGMVGRGVTNSAVKNVTTPVSGGSSGSGGFVGGKVYNASVSKGGEFANNVIGSVATGNVKTMGTISGEKANEALSSYLGYSALEEGAQNVPSFRNVEIGGGRITGTEINAKNPGGIAFGMYNTDQYMPPEGNYTTVQTADGASWYKQYAQDAVKKTPYKAPDGSIAYRESLIKKLPPTPYRKDRQ